MGKILKVSYYQNHCIDSNHILWNDRNHEVDIVGGPNTHKKSKMPDVRHFENLKSPIMTRYGTLTHIGHSQSTVKILNFWKFKMAAAICLQ